MMQRRDSPLRCMKKQFLVSLLTLVLCMCAITSTAYATETPINPVQTDQVAEAIDQSTSVLQELYGQLMGFIFENIKYIILGLLIILALSFIRFMRAFMLRTLFFIILGLVLLVTAPVITSKLLNI